MGRRDTANTMESRPGHVHAMMRSTRVLFIVAIQRIMGAVGVSMQQYYQIITAALMSSPSQMVAGIGV